MSSLGSEPGAASAASDAQRYEGSNDVPNDEEKRTHKLVLTLEAYSQADLDQALEGMQEYLIEHGLDVEGKVQLTMPLLQRRSGISGAKPMDNLWKSGETRTVEYHVGDGEWRVSNDGRSVSRDTQG